MTDLVKNVAKAIFPHLSPCNPDTPARAAIEVVLWEMGTWQMDGVQMFPLPVILMFARENNIDLEKP